MITSNNLTGVLLTIGFAAVSAYAWSQHPGEAGQGWAILSFLTLLMWSWDRSDGQ